MEKNNLIMLGLLGTLGVGAYFLFNNQNQNIGGGGAPGGAKPGSELGNPNYIFNIAAPIFPDLSSFFTDPGTTTTTTTPTTTPTTKKDTPIIIKQDDYKPGSVVIVPYKNTIPSKIPGVQNFPTVIVSDKTQAPLKLQNIFGFPVVPHLISTTSIITSKKAPITAPSTGNKAALITVGTPTQQIQQYNIAPRIYQGKKVM